MLIELPFPKTRFQELKIALEKKAHPLKDAYIIGAKGVYSASGTLDILEIMHPILSEVSGKQLISDSTFGLIYDTGGLLKAHCDRVGLDWGITFPLDEQSATWPLFVEGEPILVPFGYGAFFEVKTQEHWREPCPLGPSYWLLLHYRYNT